ncbi:MAG: hypothetical protein NVV72_01890 [Asticcacaulis sp.]|nr:hypothetical protein [Asticcacaulis sp.]
MSRDRKPSVTNAGPAGIAPSPEPALERARVLLDTPSPPPSSRQAALRTTAIFAATLCMGMATLALGDTIAPPQVAPRSDIDIRVGRNKSSGRIEIYGAIGSRASVRREKGQVVIRLPGQKKPDLGDIRSNPPVGIKGVDLKSDARASELWLTVNDGFETHFGREDGAVFVQIDPTAEDNARPDDGKKDGQVTVNLQDIIRGEETRPATPNDARVNKAAKVPVVALEVEAIDGGKDIAFPFEGPVASAVFRRGESVWIVFDSEADLRLPPELKDGAIVQDAQWTRNDGFTALRLKAPTIGALSAINDGLVWRVRLGGRPLDNKAVEASVIRDDSAGVPA